ncbi:MAG: GntR family transcriptional regulator [Phormidesmis sp.]
MGKLFSKTYLALRQEILSGELAAGECLVEQTLADRFAVSRTPIREAIRQLQQEGLIQSDQRGGLQVTTITIADAIQLYDCRLGLEQVAAVSACENATAKQLEGLKQCMVQAERSVSSPPGAENLDNRLAIDQNFHRLLAESSGNPWLVDLLEQIFGKMALLRLTTTYRNPEVLEIWAEHEKIVDALVNRDARSAAMAVRDHLVASKARVVQELQGLHSEVSMHSITLT